MIEITRSDLEQLMTLGRLKPNSWIRAALGVDLWSKQKEFVRSVRDNRNTLWDACHGVGKTRTLGSVALQFLYSYERSRVITTAPTFRQVKSILWAEIHSLHTDALIELGGTLNQVELEIREGWYAQGLSTNRADRFQGQHAPYILFIVDEGYGVSPVIFEAIRGGMSSGFVRLAVAGNPTDAGAFVAEAVRKTDELGRKTWNHLSVSAFDTPNFTELGVTIEDMRSGEWRDKVDAYLRRCGALPRPYLINPDFVAEALIEFGEDSPAWYARILGILPTTSTNTIVPLAWAEAAMARWEYSEELDRKLVRGERVFQDDNYVPLGDPEEIGVDVARFGDDDTVIAPRKGRRALTMLVYRKQDTQEVAGLVDAAHADFVRSERPLQEGEVRERGRLIKVDSNGIGAGVVDALKRLKHRISSVNDGDPEYWHHWVQGVNVSESPVDKKKYADRTTELWWNLRELLNPLNPYPIALPRDNKLLGELTGRRYGLDKHDMLQIESKDDFKKRLQRSPDRADAVVLAFAPPLRRSNIRSL